MVKPSHGRTATHLVARVCLPGNGGSLPHVERRIDEYLTPFLRHEVFTAACEQGASEHTLDFLLQYVAPVWKKAVRAAVRAGHLNVLRWMSEVQDDHGPWKEDLDDVLPMASAHGHLDIVKWLYERGIDRHTLWEILKSTPEFFEKTWLYDYCSWVALKLAVQHGHFDVVQWIYHVRTNTRCAYRDCNLIDRAVANGHIAIAKWLHDVNGRGCCSTDAADAAAENGHLEMLQWLQSNRLLTYSPSAMTRAAENGHLEVAQWLHRTHHVSYTPSAVRLASNNGHLEVVKWLYENVNVDFEDGWCATGIASCGHLQVLRWLDKHFSHLRLNTAMIAAAQNGHLEVVMWLEEHRYDASTAMVLVGTAHGGHLKIVQWFHVHYPNQFVPQAMDRAAQNGHLEVVRGLHENRREGCTTDALDFAARNGHLDVVLFLLEHRTEGFSRTAMVSARVLEVWCFFGRNDKLRPNYSLDGIRSDHLSLLMATFSRKPAFVQGCLRCLAEIAVDEGDVEILDWLNNFGLELRSTTPIRNAVRRGDLKLLQWFHQNGFQVREPDLLELAVQKDQLDVACWLSKHGYTICSLKLVEVAGRNNNVPLIRWLVEHGPPLNLSVANTLVMESRYEEIAAWISEPDREQLILEALRREDREVLWWILTRTQFDREDSHRNIRDAIQQAPEGILLWLQKSLSPFEGCKWCFTASKKNDLKLGNVGRSIKRLK